MTINTRSIRKKEELKQLIYTNQVDVIGVQETWIGENKISLNMRGYKIANTKFSQKTGAGMR